MAITTNTTTTNGNGLLRPRYFNRQRLTAEDLMVAQHYLRERLRRHNRFLHGWGIVCGVEVIAADSNLRVHIGEGYLVTPGGDEVYIPSGITIDLCELPGFTDCVPDSDPCAHPEDLEAPREEEAARRLRDRLRLRRDAPLHAELLETHEELMSLSHLERAETLVVSNEATRPPFEEAAPLPEEPGNQPAAQPSAAPLDTQGMIEVFLVAYLAETPMHPQPAQPARCDPPGSHFEYSRVCEVPGFKIVCDLPPLHEPRDSDEECRVTDEIICGQGEVIVACPPQPAPHEDYVVLARIWVGGEPAWTDARIDNFTFRRHLLSEELLVAYLRCTCGPAPVEPGRIDLIEKSLITRNVAEPILTSFAIIGDGLAGATEVVFDPGDVTLTEILDNTNPLMLTFNASIASLREGAEAGQRAFVVKFADGRDELHSADFGVFLTIEDPAVVPTITHIFPRGIIILARELYDPEPRDITIFGTGLAGAGGVQFLFEGNVDPDISETITNNTADDELQVRLILELSDDGTLNIPPGERFFTVMLPDGSVLHSGNFGVSLNIDFHVPPVSSVDDLMAHDDPFVLIDPPDDDPIILRERERILEAFRDPELDNPIIVDPHVVDPGWTDPSPEEVERGFGVAINPDEIDMGRGEQPVSRVSGIGRTFARRLAEAGINTTRAFVSIPTMRAAEILGLSMDRAAGLQRAGLDHMRITR